MRNRERYDNELNSLTNQLHDLGQLTAAAVARALQALADQDVTLSRQIIDDDPQIDQARHQIEEHAISLIALQQPVAGDLRRIVAVIAISGELERIADYAKRIAKLVIGPEGAAPLEIPADLLQLGALARASLDHALVTVATHDEARARTLAGEDEQIDRLYKQLKVRLAASLKGSQDPGRTADMLFVAHILERIADRATNVAERVIYWASAKQVDLNP